MRLQKRQRKRIAQRPPVAALEEAAACVFVLSDTFFHHERSLALIRKARRLGGEAPSWLAIAQPIKASGPRFALFDALHS